MKDVFAACSCFGLLLAAGSYQLARIIFFKSANCLYSGIARQMVAGVKKNSSTFPPFS